MSRAGYLTGIYLHYQFLLKNLAKTWVKERAESQAQPANPQVEGVITNLRRSKLFKEK